MEESTLTTLERAIRYNDIKTFRYTLETEGLPSDYHDYDLLIKALRFGCKRIVKLLLEKRCQVSKPGSSTTPLHIAVTKVGWLSVVVKLLQRGCRVIVTDDNGDTPVHVAFANNSPGSVIDALLRHYMDEMLVDLINKDGLGMLHIACTRNHLHVVRNFIDVGGCNTYSQVASNIDSIYAGYSPLHFAVENGRYDIAKFLCDYQVDIGTCNSKGSTPLHLAVDRRDVRMIDILILDADLNENYANNAGLSHFMAACAGSDFEFVEQYLRIAADKSANSPIVMISAEVKDLDDCFFAGYTPLHFAVEFDRLETVELLLDHGAHCTGQKLSPLDIARKQNHESIIALLERHCNSCKTCKNVIVDSVTEKSEVCVDVNCNETEQKIAIDRFNWNLTENQTTSLDECCYLDILPVPEIKIDFTSGRQKDDCDLCQLQELCLLDDNRNESRSDNCDENETQKFTKNAYQIRRSKINVRHIKYFSNRQIFQFLISVAACVSIVTSIVFISKYKLS